MEQEKKQLILQDLCARSPYGVYVLADVQKTFDGGIIGKVSGVNIESGLVYLEGILTPFTIEEIRPYLRSLSSMTDEDFLALYDMCVDKVYQFRWHPTYYTEFKTEKYVPDFMYNPNQLDYLILHHFDYRGLIPKNLAIEAPSNMYKIK